MTLQPLQIDYSEPAPSILTQIDSQGYRVEPSVAATLQRIADSLKTLMAWRIIGPTALIIAHERLTDLIRNSVYPRG